MTSKLTVYVDDWVRRSLKESAGPQSISKLVNDALESYLSATLVRDLGPPSRNKTSTRGFPSISEVKRRRPRAKGSSAEIITSQRRGRNARLS